MKLYDKKLERRLLASVKTTREWKTRRRPGVLLRKFSLEKPYLYIPLGLIFLVAIESMQAEKGLEWILFGLALYCFAEAVRRGRRLNLHLTSSNERAFFFFYPMSAESFFRLALERSILGSLTVWCVAAVTYAVATRTEGPWIFRTIAYATLEWLLTVIVMLLIVRKIQWVPQWLQISLYVVLVLALNAPASLWHTITLATSILPTSWSNASFLYLQSGTVAWLAIAAEILVAAGLASWLRTGTLPGPAAAISLPLDVGSVTDIVPPHLRRAIIIRDRHCAAPGCDQPPAACHVHHIVPRSRGGTTSLSNCLLLCSFHHLILIHRWGWSITLNPDGTTTMTSPYGRTLHSHGPPTAAA